MLPKILCELDAQQINYQLSLIGDGPDLQALKQKIGPWILQKRVMILGKKNQKAVRKIMAQHDIFLLFSKYEGLPLALLEAMAQGLVPVVSDLGKDFRALLRGTGGKVVSPANPRNYALAIRDLALKPSTLQAFGTSCRKRVRKKFSHQAMVRRWIRFIGRVKTCNAGKLTWPHPVIIKPPLSHESRLLYSPCFRPLRRIFKSILIYP